MSHHGIVLGVDTEWFEEVSEDDYRAAVAQLHAKRVGSKSKWRHGSRSLAGLRPPP